MHRKTRRVIQLYADIMFWKGSDYGTKNYLLSHKGANGERSTIIDWTGWMYCSANIQDIWHIRMMSTR